MSLQKNDTIGWDIPLTNGGREDGLNDSGISFFKKEPLRSLSKETCQDTLDAKHSNDSPAVIEYQVMEVPVEKIPGYEELRAIYQVAESYFIPKKNETHKFFKKAVEVINSDTIKVCAIRDRNTSGLTNVKLSEDSHFHRLVKTTGDTGKTGTSNGSYGIGKHAPYATSYLRAMLYGTLNRENERGFQGVIKIASFNNGKEFLTQGTGFYGKTQGYKPLHEKEGLAHIDHIFLREDGDYGTDKFILGFNADENWEKEVIEEAVLSYMYAILNGQLEVKVGETVITKETLSSVIEAIQEFNSDSKVMEFYKTLTSPLKKEFIQEFKTPEGTKETVKLYILEDENFHNKIALTRGTGMKIYEKGNFRTPLTFAGTLIVLGERLNEVFRLMEPPTHDAWSPKLYEADSDYAKKLKENLYSWLNKIVRDLTPKFESESFELPGLENILPAASADDAPLESVNLEDGSEKVKSLIITNNSMNPSKKKKKRKPRGNNPTLPRTIPPKSATNKPNLKKVRAFCIKPEEGLYKVVISPSNDGEISLKVNLVGESLTSSASISKVIEPSTAQEFIIRENNLIGPFLVKKDTTVELLLSLDNLTRYSLEVERV